MTEAAALVEIGNGRVLLQAFYHFCSLVREAVAPVRGRVVGLVVAICKNVRHHYDGYDHEDVDRCVGRVLGWSCFEPLSIHLRPPTQGFHGTRGEEESQENYGDIKHGVFRIEDAFGERFEVGDHRDVREHARPASSFVSADPLKNPEQQADSKGGCTGDDLT